MKKILITGPSGVIGLNLLAHFSREKAKGEQIEIHALSKREIPEISLQEFCKGPIIFHKSILDLEDSNFEMIFNCGGPSQPSVFTANPRLIIEANILEIPILLRKLTGHGTFIQMGTSELYSGCKQLPCTEDHRGVLETHNPRRTYVLAKEMAEVILQTHAKRDQTILALRVSLVFGPGATLSDTRVMYELIKKGLSGNILIEGSPSALRRYLYIVDFLEAIKILIEKSEPGFHVYNLGGDESLSILDIATEIAQQTGSPIELKPILDARTVGAPAEVWVSLDKLTRTVGEQNFSALSEGLIPTISWTRKLLESER